MRAIPPSRVDGVPYRLLLSLAKVGVLLGVGAILIFVVLPGMTADYGASPFLDARTVVWLVMELHLMLAAFVLGVPIFAMIVEIVGVAAKDEKYDRLAWEFTRLLALAFTATAVLGVLGLASLVLLYPKFMTYLGKIFSPTLLPYAAAIVADAVLLVVYYYAWGAMQGRLKWLHIVVGALLNLVGTVLMCIANAWTTFMMSPAGVAENGALASLSQAIQNPLWWPINVHRIIANVAFGGAIAAAYAAIRFLSATSDEERAHYDWMGYVGNFVAMWALIPLPFAGYWLGREIYAFSAQMGTSLMGGDFSWVFIIQAVLIGYSVYQVIAVLFAMIVITALDLYLFFGAKSLGPVQWGSMPRRSQYVLVLLAVVFTLTIGLMGFVRSGIRETWHVYGIMRDTSVQAYTPTMGYGGSVIAAATFVFFALLFLVFWLGMRAEEEE